MKDGTIIFEAASFSDGAGNRLEISARDADKPNESLDTAVFSYDSANVKMSLSDGRWHTVAITTTIRGSNSILVVYIDGKEFGRQLFKFQTAVAGETLEVGRSIQKGSYYQGFMRGPYFFPVTLSDEQLAELHAPSSASDVAPAYGWTTFDDLDPTTRVEISVLPDDIPEIKEKFLLSILSVSNGGFVGNATDEAGLSIAENDDARGVFGIRVDAEAEEGDVISVIVERPAGLFGTVKIGWALTLCEQCDNRSPKRGKCTKCPGNDAADLNQTKGTFTFKNGDETIKVPLLVVADGEPEVEERYTFRIQTVNGFARHKNEAATVVVAKSDHPYGQFFLATSDNKRFATVGEGVGEVKLSILRVGGTKGDVPVMYKVQRIGQTSEADFFSSRRERDGPRRRNAGRFFYICCG